MTKCPLVVAALAVCLALVAPLEAAYYVDPSGDDGNDCTSVSTPCQTISAAIGKAPDGEEILLAAGTYAEQVNIENRLSLVLRGTTGVSIVDPGSPPGDAVVRVIASLRVGLFDLAISGTVAGVLGVRIQDSQLVEIERCSVTNSRIAIEADSSNRVRIMDSTIQNNTYGIAVDLGTRADVRDSTINDNQVGLWVSDSLQMNGSNQLAGNDVGILAEGANIEVGGATIAPPTDGVGLLMYGGRARLVGVAISGGAFGIQNVSGYLHMTGSQVSNCSIDGIQLADSATLRISTTTVSANAGHGVSAVNLSAVRLFGSAELVDNGLDDLHCEQGSIARGDASGVADADCPWSV